MALDANEKPNKPIVKFESMLKTDDVYFFDSEDFEDIIHHYLNNGKISLAKKAIKIGLHQHTASIELKLLDVEVLVFENEFEIAEKLLEDLQTIDSTNEEIYIQRANIYSKKDNHEEAVVLLEQALDLTSDNIDIYALLGMEYLFMDNFEMAKINFIKCVDADEYDYSSLYNIIHCFEFLEDYDGAILYLNKYLERNPYCEVAWHQLGKQYYTKDMHNEALIAFDFAIISDDKFIGAYFEKGKVLEKLGRYNEAIENYEITIDIDDPTAHAYLRMAKCHEKLNNNDLAKYYYYNSVHEDPSSDKGWLAITNFYHKEKDYEKALFYIDKAINIDVDNAFYWKKNAQIHIALQNYEEANNSYQKAVDLGNYDLDTWLVWSEVMILNGDLNSAAQILSQAMDFYPDEAEISYKLTGIYLLMDADVKAKNQLLEAMHIDIDKLSIFKSEFPQFYKTEWTQSLIAEFKKASN